MISLGLSVTGIDQAIRALEGVERGLPSVNESIARDGSLLISRRLKERMSDPGSSDPFWGRIGGAGNTLTARSGQSRARISPGGRVITVGDVAFAEVGSPDVHVAAHEEGFHQERARIPTAAAQTAQGVDRNKGVKLKSIPGAFYLRSRAGNLWGAIRRGRELVLLYLYKAVDHRGRHVFSDTRDQTAPEIERMAENRVRALVEGRGNGA